MDFDTAFDKYSLTREPRAIVGTEWFAAPEIMLAANINVPVLPHTVGLEGWSLTHTHTFWR